MTAYVKLLRHGSMYAVSVVLSKLASMCLLPVYTRYLSPTDYGIMELLELTSFIVITLIGINLSDAVFCYYAEAQTAAERNLVISTALIGAAAVSCIAALLGLCAARTLSRIVFGAPDWARFFRITFITIAFSLPQEIGLAYLRARSQSSTVAAFQIGRLLITIVLNLLFLIHFSLGIVSVLYSALISSAVSVVLLTVVLYRNERVLFQWTLFWKLFRFALPLGLAGLAMLCVNFGDRAFLVRWVSLSDIGIYSLAYKLGMLVSYVQLPFSMYWNAEMYSVVKERGGTALYARVCTYFLFALTAAALALSIFARPLLVLLAAPSFAAAAQYVPAVAFAYVLRGLGDYFRNVFSLEKRPSMNLAVLFVGAFVCLSGYAVLIPAFRMWGAVIATQLSFAAMAVAAFISGQKVRPFRFEFGRIARLLLSATLCWMALQTVHPRSISASVLTGAVAFAAWPVVLYCWRFFNARELQILTELGARMRALAERRAAPPVTR